MGTNSPATSILTGVTRGTVTVAVTETIEHRITPKMWEALAKLATQPLDVTAMSWYVGTRGRTGTLCSRLVRAGLAEHQKNICMITEVGRAALAQQLATS